MEKIVFKGDLFIKYTPTIVNQRIYDKNEEIFNMHIEDLNKENLEDALLLFADKIDEILANKDYQVKRVEDYSNNLGFYCLSLENDKIILTSENNIVETFTYDEESGISIDSTHIFYDFDSIDDVRKHFIPLSTFLNNATYMGYYLKSDEDIIQVLYEYLDTYFIINGAGKFTVVSKHHPVLNEYNKTNSFEDNFDKKNIRLTLIKKRLTNNGHGPTR